MHSQATRNFTNKLFLYIKPCYKFSRCGDCGNFANKRNRCFLWKETSLQITQRNPQPYIILPGTETKSGMKCYFAILLGTEGLFIKIWSIKVHDISSLMMEMQEASGTCPRFKCADDLNFNFH